MKMVMRVGRLLLEFVVLGVAALVALGIGLLAGTLLSMFYHGGA